jgi:site-specific recombinase XerC
LQGKVAPSTEYRNYSGLRRFFAWCVREDELDVSPLENIKPPKVPEPRTEMLTREQTKALLASCAGKDLISRRDTAILLLLAGRSGPILRCRVRRWPPRWSSITARGSAAQSVQ